MRHLVINMSFLKRFRARDAEGYPLINLYLVVSFKHMYISNPRFSSINILYLTITISTLMVYSIFYFVLYIFN